MPALLKALVISLSLCSHFSILLAARISELFPVQWQSFFGCSGHKGGYQHIWAPCDPAQVTATSKSRKPWKGLIFSLFASQRQQPDPIFESCTVDSFLIIQLLAIWKEALQGHNVQGAQRDEFCWRFQRWSWEIYICEVGTRERFFIQVYHTWFCFNGCDKRWFTRIHPSTSQVPSFLQTSAVFVCFPTSWGRAACQKLGLTVGFDAAGTNSPAPRWQRLAPWSLVSTAEQTLDISR